MSDFTEFKAMVIDPALNDIKSDISELKADMKTHTDNALDTAKVVQEIKTLLTSKIGVIERIEKWDYKEREIHEELKYIKLEINEIKNNLLVKDTQSKTWNRIISFFAGILGALLIWSLNNIGKFLHLIRH